MYTIYKCTGGETHMATKNTNNSRLVVPGAKQAIEQMKYEIASELGVNMGPDATSRANGSVGGEITKRLVQMGQQHLSNSNYSNYSK